MKVGVCVCVCDQTLSELAVLHLITDHPLPCSRALSTGVSVTAV